MRIIKSYTCIIACAVFFITSQYTLYAQEFIKNGSFEEDGNESPITRYREDTLQGSRICAEWFQAGKGSPDFFNSDISRFRAFALMKAHTGEGRLSFYLAQKDFSDSLENYREYIETQLAVPLKAGTEYCIVFYIAFEQRSKYCAKNIGVCLTKDSLLGIDENVIATLPQLNYSDTTGIAPKGEWLRLNFTYKAKGGEQFLTIGNFDNGYGVKLKKYHKKKRYKTTWSPEFNRYAYYYIDDVSLIPVNNTCTTNDTRGNSATKYYKGSIPLIALTPLKFAGIGLAAFAIFRVIQSGSGN